MKKEDTKSKKKPFFARYLESQQLDEVRGGAVTLKFPSDRDEGDQTMKWPSDGDEGDPV